jgi:hypothetical protein
MSFRLQLLYWPTIVFPSSVDDEPQMPTMVLSYVNSIKRSLKQRACFSAIEGIEHLPSNNVPREIIDDRLYKALGFIWKYEIRNVYVPDLVWHSCSDPNSTLLF